MEHAIHLAAGHFISTVALTAVRRLMDKMNQCEPVNSEDEDDDKDSDVAGLPDAVGKTLALATQVD
jgi:hypothetical protein